MIVKPDAQEYRKSVKPMIKYFLVLSLDTYVLILFLYKHEHFR